MANPKYPKKFRQKLEQIRAAREEREKGNINPFRTFAHTAADAWKVSGLATRITDRRMHTAITSSGPRRNNPPRRQQS